MLTPKIAGALIIVLPALVLAWAVLWKRQRPIFWFALALILVGTGYLAATGATDDIANKLMPGLTASEPAKAG
jgi:dipeptide/tripeptide permease